MSIWLFTGITMIIEGVFDAASLFVRLRKIENSAEINNAEARPDLSEQESEPCERGSGVVQ